MNRNEDTYELLREVAKAKLILRRVEAQLPKNDTDQERNETSAE